MEIGCEVAISYTSSADVAETIAGAKSLIGAPLARGMRRSHALPTLFVHGVWGSWLRWQLCTARTDNRSTSSDSVSGPPRAGPHSPWLCDSLHIEAGSLALLQPDRPRPSTSIRERRGQGRRALAPVRCSPAVSSHSQRPALSPAGEMVR